MIDLYRYNNIIFILMIIKKGTYEIYFRIIKKIRFKHPLI